MTKLMKRTMCVLVALFMLCCACPTIAALAETDKTVELVMWGWNAEWQKYLDNFAKNYPDSGVTVRFVNKSIDVYSTSLDLQLAEGQGEDYPDLFAIDASFNRKYINSEYTLPLNQIFDEADLNARIEKAGIPDYIISFGSDENGVLKGLAFQNTSCVTIYRRSLAKEYLGTDDPDEIAKYMTSMDTYYEAAKIIHDKSGGKVKAMSSTADIVRTYYAMCDKAFVDEDNKMVVSDAALDYIVDMKKWFDEGLLNNTVQKSDAYWADANGTADVQSVFFVGAPWRLGVNFLANCPDTYGDWGVCSTVPASTFHGGTWVAVGKDYDPAKKEAIQKVLDYIGLDTSEGGQFQYTANNGDCPASQAVVDRLSETYTNALAGGQNTLKAYMESASKLSGDSNAVKNWKVYTNSFINALDNAAQAYISGSAATLTDAVNSWVFEVQSQYDVESPDVAAVVADYESRQ